MSVEELSSFRRSILKTIYCRSINGLSCSSEAVSREILVEPSCVEEDCRGLAEDGLVAEKNGDGEWLLTEGGRKRIVVVFTGGVFDIIHPGHIYTLTAAKNLGDVLVVTVATDKTVNKMKGHAPLNGEDKRVELAAALRVVDLVLLGSETDMFEVVEQVKPDVIALGYDQKHDMDELALEARRRGLHIKVVRFDTPMPEIKSSKIINETNSVKEF
jgi:rfaE bifunctional protein nucleotidyltransferase chain/domain